MLTTLSGELQDRVIRFLPVEDQQSLRLVARAAISDVATRCLFEFLRLRREPKHIERVNKILSVPRLRQCIRTVEVHILDELITDEAADEWAERPFALMIQRVIECDRILNVHLLSLCPRPQGPPDPSRSYHWLFELIVNLVAERTQSRPWIRYYIFDTSISALNNLTPHLFPAILKIAPQLSRLHLWVTHSPSSPTTTPSSAPTPSSGSLASPDSSPVHQGSPNSTALRPTPPPVPPIFTTLREIYLLPSMLSLTELRLSSALPYGYLPKLDLRGIFFPHLRHLSLRNFTFTHQWQFEWIYQHAGTIEDLVLVASPIVRRVVIGGPLDEDGYPLDPARCKAGEEECRFSFETRWYEVFDHIREHFHRLVEFGFDQRNMEDEEGEEEDGSLYAGVYATFDRKEEEMWNWRPSDSLRDWVKDKRHLESLELKIDRYVEALGYWL
ncbi:hypothetical protein AX16_009133 [Volvariella volvacea WC 439]|nr:hypothetical protein AX16_009133 [Volvariella volvacea WC 439]